MSVGIEIYQLTPIGKKLARSTSNPDNSAWRVVHFLDQVGHSTKEQIAGYCGISTGEVASILGTLRRKKVVTETTGVSV